MDVQVNKFLVSGVVLVVQTAERYCDERSQLLAPQVDSGQVVIPDWPLSRRRKRTRFRRADRFAAGTVCVEWAKMIKPQRSQRSLRGIERQLAITRIINKFILGAKFIEDQTVPARNRYVFLSSPEILSVFSVFSVCSVVSVPGFVQRLPHRPMGLALRSL